MDRKRTFAGQTKEWPTAASAGIAAANNQTVNATSSYVVGDFMYEKVCITRWPAMAMPRCSSLPVGINGQHSDCFMRLSFVTDSEFPDANNNNARSMPESGTWAQIPAQVSNVHQAEPSADFNAPKPKRIRTTPQNK